MAPQASPAPARANAQSGPIAWLAVGGGSTPASTQFALEADLKLATRTFAGDGRVLFAGGADSLSVQVDAGEQRGDPLLRALGALFAPRAGRNARYREPDLPGALPATRDRVLGALEQQLSVPGVGDLLVYVAAHGEVGQVASENTIGLWAGERITPVDLAQLFDRHRAERTVRLVLTSCFSGGFGELVFELADHQRGPAPTIRCGLFAAPWDLESSGCDANADRRRHEGYGRHFLAALRGLDREGRALTPDQIDFDRDGRVSLLEAHTRVRVASLSADVPTTTSERWLRAVAPPRGTERRVHLPEEEAVIAALSQKLRVPTDKTAIEALYQSRQDAVTDADAATRLAQQQEDAAWNRLTAELLARWPVLDDPFHPEFGQTLQTHRDAIGRVLMSSQARREYDATVQVTDASARLLDQARIAASLAERLERALTTRTLASRLQAVGGEDLARFLALRRCETWVPELRAPGGAEGVLREQGAPDGAPRRADAVTPASRGGQTPDATGTRTPPR